MDALAAMLTAFTGSGGYLTVLTGAGISAESGIPTFRGPEGYWTVGSREYHPQEMATHAMFLQEPAAVWQWYLYRLGVCGSAKPNAGHYAVYEMEKRFGDRFILITQNIDGLHLTAGNSAPRTYQIHGNVHYMRCARECTPAWYPVPEALHGRDKHTPLHPSDMDLLVCPSCGHLTRPHVLWFDEAYDEPRFRLYSALRAASRTNLLIVVGTAGATNLPNQVVHEVYRNGGTIIDINIEHSPFSSLAESSPGGAFIQASGSQALQQLLQYL